MSVRVVILGAGFGGLELASRLAEDLVDEVDVTLIDQSDSFLFGFAKLDVMFGKRSSEQVLVLPRRRQAERRVPAGESPDDRPADSAGGHRSGAVRGRRSGCRARRPRPTRRGSGQSLRKHA